MSPYAVFPRRRPALLISSLLALSAPTAVLAGELTSEAGVLATWQSASDDRVHDELQGSADLVVAMPVGNGVLAAHVEASTTPVTDGVSSLIGEANGDAGSALDADGKGRVQLSEFHYTLPAGAGELSLGLIDTAGPLDNSDVANDANSQFLAAGLGNNATIAFPDYTLGAFYRLPLGDNGSGVTLLVAGSQGLGDSADAGYGALFDLGESGRGAFVAAEWQQVLGWGAARLGAWTSTADHDSVDGSAGGLANYGLYLSADTRLGDVALNVRLGAAREDVSEAARFASVAAELPLADRLSLGAGVAWTGVSADKAGGEDSVQSELYLRWEPVANLQLSPSVQYIRNPGFDGSGSSVDADSWVMGLRVGYSL